jgi:hypothetical protein
VSVELEPALGATLIERELVPSSYWDPSSVDVEDRELVELAESTVVVLPLLVVPVAVDTSPSAYAVVNPTVEITAAMATPVRVRRAGCFRMAIRSLVVGPSRPRQPPP